MKWRVFRNRSQEYGECICYQLKELCRQKMDEFTNVQIPYYKTSKFTKELKNSKKAALGYKKNNFERASIVSCMFTRLF